MAQRPHVLLSAAVSIDGYLDDNSQDRLTLSNEADFDRVDEVRAESDAIMIGAGTIRTDNPRLLVKSDARRAARVARGLPEFPLKVTVTASGNLDADAKFWHYGGQKLVYTNDSGAERLRERLLGLAEVVSLGPAIDDFGLLLDDLGNRGIDRLMVEGGGQIHTAFLSQGLADEMHVVIAPLVVGQATAPRFLSPADYVGGPHRRMKLLEARQIEDVALLRYAPKQESGL